MEYFLISLLISVIIAYFYNPFKNDELSKQVLKVFKFQNIIITTVIIFCIFTTQAQQSWLGFYNFWISDILLICGLYYLGFMYYTNINIQSQLKNLRSGKSIDYQLKQTIAINVIILILVVGILLLENLPFFSGEENSQQTFYRYSFMQKLEIWYQNIREVYLGFFLIFVEVQTIPFLVHTLLENPVKRIKKVFRKKQDLPYFSQFMSDDSDEEEETLDFNFQKSGKGLLQKPQQSIQQYQDEISQNNNYSSDEEKDVFCQKPMFKQNRSKNLYQQYYQSNFFINKNQQQNDNQQQNAKGKSKKDSSVSKLKKCWILITSVGELFMVFSIIFSLIHLGLQIFYPEGSQIIDWFSVSFKDMFDNQFQSSGGLFLIEFYCIIIKISYLIYTLSEAVLIHDENKAKKLLKPYRDQIAFQKYSQFIQVFFITMVLIIVLYPALVLQNHKNDSDLQSVLGLDELGKQAMKQENIQCYQKYNSMPISQRDQECSLTLLGHTTMEIFRRGEILYTQYAVLIYTIIYSVFKTGKIFLNPNQ